MFSIRATIVAAALMGSMASATDRFYPDSFAISPSGRYRIDAKSPDNQQRRPFASNFTYTLTDLSTGKVVWERKQPMTRQKGSSHAWPAEGSPMRVYVNDDGLVAAYISSEGLLLLDGSSGKKLAEAPLLGAITKQEDSDYVSHTTAGPMWTQGSEWYFLSLAPQGKSRPRTYFVVRPYWGKRLIVDARTGTHVDLESWRGAASVEDLKGASEDIQRLLTAAIQEETRLALAALQDAAAKLEDDKEYRAYWRVQAALRTVIMLKLQEAEPSLRELEGRMDDSKHTYSSLRGAVREALRAIGKAPAPGYGVRLYPLKHNGSYWSADTEQPYKAVVSLEERVNQAGAIVAGMSLKEMTDLIGCPDASSYAKGGRCYDYDIDAPAPYTLRVYVDQQERTVRAVERITPFAFLHDNARMRSY